jgi:hypothetical protein
MPTTRRTRKSTPAAVTTTEPTVTADSPAITTTDNTDTATPTGTDTPTSDATTAAPTSEATVTDAAQTDAVPTATTTVGDVMAAAPVSGAPVSGAPVGNTDHFKIVMVAGVLGDHPDGVSAADIVDESGLRGVIVARVLAAMEAAEAAVRKPAAEGDTSGVELWLRGDADLSTVDLSRTILREVCPTCDRPMPRRNTVNVGRTAGPTRAGLNGDGQQVLGKNELRDIVRGFLAEHPGHEFTAGDISKEINRSSGAIANALNKLVISGDAILVNDAPMKYSAPEKAADDSASTDNAGADNADDSGPDSDATGEAAGQ